MGLMWCNCSLAINLRKQDEKRHMSRQEDWARNLEILLIDV